MPVYNAGRFLTEAIESVLAQTYDHWELILIDDASQDNSAILAQEYAARDIRIRFFANPQNLGVAKTRNRALGLARGKYVAPLDNDDIALPNRLEEQVCFLEAHPAYALVASDIEIINEYSQPVALRVYPHQDREIRKVLTRMNPIANPASMFRRSVFDSLGGMYDESVCPVEDYEFVFRVAAAYKVANLAFPLTRYRMTSTQAKSVYLKKTLRTTLKIQRRALAAGVDDSLFNRCYRIGLVLLLLLPDTMVMSLFKRLCFRSERKD